jgi:hypothetical protein
MTVTSFGCNLSNGMYTSSKQTSPASTQRSDNRTFRLLQNNTAAGGVLLDTFVVPSSYSYNAKNNSQQLQDLVRYPAQKLSSTNDYSAKNASVKSTLEQMGQQPAMNYSHEKFLQQTNLLKILYPTAYKQPQDGTKILSVQVTTAHVSKSSTTIHGIFNALRYHALLSDLLPKKYVALAIHVSLSTTLRVHNRLQSAEDHMLCRAQPYTFKRPHCRQRNIIRYTPLKYEGRLIPTLYRWYPAPVRHKFKDNTGSTAIVLTGCRRYVMDSDPVFNIVSRKQDKARNISGEFWSLISERIPVYDAKIPWQRDDSAFIQARDCPIKFVKNAKIPRPCAPDRAERSNNFQRRHTVRDATNPVIGRFPSLRELEYDLLSWFLAQSKKLSNRLPQIGYGRNCVLEFFARKLWVARQALRTLFGAHETFAQTFGYQTLLHTCQNALYHVRNPRESILLLLTLWRTLRLYQQLQ